MSASTFAMVSVGQVLLVRWGGPTRVAEIDEMRRASRELALSHPRGIAHMNLVDVDGTDVQELDDPSREAILRMLRERDVPLRLSSVIFPKPGFQAALVRAILGGLLLLSRTPAHVRVHSSVREGAAWLVAGLRSLRAHELPEVGALVDAMEKLREEARAASLTR